MPTVSSAKHFLRSVSNLSQAGEAATQFGSTSQQELKALAHSSEDFGRLGTAETATSRAINFIPTI